jgi:hypothetical protein
MRGTHFSEKGGRWRENGRPIELYGQGRVSRDFI